jgi:signal transduction histidine kinase
LASLEHALEQAGLTPPPAGRIALRAGRALAAGSGAEAAAEALRLLVADWALAAVTAGRRPDELGPVLRTAAARVAREVDGFLFAACSRALANPEVRRLAPRVAVDTQLRLLHAFTGLEAVSLWVRDGDGSLQCVASSGHPRRAARAEAAAAIAGEHLPGAAPVCRFGKVAGAVVTSAPVAGPSVQAFVEETAAALGFYLERDLLLERNAARERSLTAALESRLLRLGFDIHDGPLQNLAALGSDLALARRQIVPLVCADDAERVAGRLDDLESRLNALDDALRETLRPLTAPAGDDDLADVLRREVSSLRSGSGLDASVAVHGDVDVLAAEQRQAVVRVVQEALSNVRHHSRARSVRVSLDGRDGELEVSVEDDGRGFDLGRALAAVAARRRFGLVGMRERIRLLGGDLAIETAPGEGTRLSFVLQPRQPVAGPDKKAAA